MRTTLDIDDDVLAAAESRARAEGKTVGLVLSELARTAFATTALPARDGSFLGITPLPRRGVIVTNELIDALREEGSE